MIRMLENVKQVTIEPLIRATVAANTKVFTDEYDIYARLPEGDMFTARSATREGSMLGTMTETVSMRFMSILSKVSGRFCVHGSDPIVAYPRNASLCI